MTSLPLLADHPLYRQVETYIRQGNWQASLVPLTELLTLYPQDDHLQEIAASVRTRSALLGFDQEPVTARSDQSRPHKLRILVLSLLIMLGLCGVIGGGSIFFSAWVLPEWQSQRQETRISQLHEEADSALASGDYDRAVLAYNGILELRPDDNSALAGLEQANQLRATASLYSEAIIQMEAHRWEDALALLHQLETQQPDYGDVVERINFIQTQQGLTQVFSEAEAAFSENNYERAIEKYQQLQTMDYGFQSDAVQKHLFLSYLQLGLAQEAAAGRSSEKLEGVLNILEKALALRPKDSQVRGESQLIRLYLSGLAEFEAGDWSQAITDLTPVYEARPDFADGSAGEMLYAAYLGRGDELFADEQFEQALTTYEQADSIKGVNKSDLESKIALTQATLTAPTPTPAPGQAIPAGFSGSGGGSVLPAPTATPLPQPFALAGMSVRNNCSGFGYIHGVVWTAYNMPLAGVQVQAMNTTTGVGPLISNPTNGDGIYQIILNGDQIEGLWTVQVLDETGQPVSQAWGQHLGGECQNGAQELKVDWQRGLQIGE
ncbi:MAG: hypothetical protein AB1801_10525 [Chloroflexota bacterium]